MAVLYRHIRIDKNEPFYIGIGDKENRAYSQRSRNRFWKNIAKQGYEVEILFKDLTWEQACEKEKEFITLYGRRDLKAGTLVNLTDGGEGTLGYRHKEETKGIIRSKLKGENHPNYGKKRPEHSEKLKGDKNPCYGRVGVKNPRYGVEGYWKGKERLDNRNKVLYKGVEFESQTALAKYLNCTVGNITRLVKRNIVQKLN